MFQKSFLHSFSISELKRILLHEIPFHYNIFCQNWKDQSASNNLNGNYIFTHDILLVKRMTSCYSISFLAVTITIVHKYIMKTSSFHNCFLSRPRNPHRYWAVTYPPMKNTLSPVQEIGKPLCMKFCKLVTTVQHALHCLKWQQSTFA